MNRDDNHKRYDAEFWIELAKNNLDTALAALERNDKEWLWRVGGAGCGVNYAVGNLYKAADALGVTLMTYTQEISNDEEDENDD